MIHRIGLLRSLDARYAILLLVLCLLLWTPRLTGPIDVRFDGGVYYVLGTALAEGKGYRLLSEPGEIEAVQYPPLLPLIVAGHQRMLGTSEFLIVGHWLRIFYLGLSLVYTVAIYGLARPHLSPGYAFLAAALCALSLQTYYLSDLLYCEIPFALATTLFVIWNRNSDRGRYGVLAAAAAVAAYLLRTAGLALLVAWVAESLWRRRFRQMAARAAIAAVPVLLWQAHISRVESSQEYRSPAYAYQRARYLYSNVSYAENTMRLINPFFPEEGPATFTALLGRTTRNLTSVPLGLGEVLSAPVGFWKWPLRNINTYFGAEVLPLGLAVPPVIFLGLLALGLLVVGGAVLQTNRRECFVPLYLAASAGVMCLTPWPEQFLRYLTPLMPFLTLALVCALAFIRETAGKWWPGRWRKVGAVFGILTVGTLLLSQGLALAGVYVGGRSSVSYYDRSGTRIVRRLFFYGQPWPDLDEALEWLRRRANAGDVIATTVPHTAYVRIGLKTVTPPLEVDAEKARRLLDSVPVKYVVLDELPYPGFSQRYAAPAVEGHPELWKEIYVAPAGKARVYERQP